MKLPWKTLNDTVKKYEQILPDPKNFASEFELWKLHIANIPEEEVPKTILQSMDHCDKDFFPNIYINCWLFLLPYQ